MAQSDEKNTPWGMKKRGFTKLSGDEILTPIRPSAGRTVGGSTNPTPRKVVTRLPEIKQLNWAENGNGELITKFRNQTGYLIRKDGRGNDHGPCWLCGKQILNKEQLGTNFLGKLEVEHALPLKLGYNLLTIPGEGVANDNGIVTYHSNIKEDQYYTKDKLNEMSIEILRSHRLCNNLKSNLNFFMFNGERWVPKTDLIELFEEKLTELQTNLNDDGKTVPDCVVNQASLDAICRRLNEKTGGDIQNLVEEIGNKVYIEVLESERIDIWKQELIKYLSMNITEGDEQIIKENSQILETSYIDDAGTEEELEDTATTENGTPIKTKREPFRSDLAPIGEDTTFEMMVKDALKAPQSPQRAPQQDPPKNQFDSPVTGVLPTAYNQSGNETIFGTFSPNEKRPRTNNF